jgi:hypothetical protein
MKAYQLHSKSLRSPINPVEDGLLIRHQCGLGEPIKLHGPVGGKLCTRCKTIKPLSDFSDQKRGRYGRSPWCKKCVIAKRLSRACTISLKEKRCSRCKQVKPIDSFQVSRSAPHGRQSQCIECQRWTKIQSKYGLTKQQFEAILISQNGVCDICKIPTADSLLVDHCHSTGKVRGLLCNRCNSALGYVRDNTEIIGRLSDYIKKHQS